MFCLWDGPTGELFNLIDDVFLVKVMGCSTSDSWLVLLQHFQFLCRMAPSTRRIQSMTQTLNLISPTSLIRYCDAIIHLLTASFPFPNK